MNIWIRKTEIRFYSTWKAGACTEEACDLNLSPHKSIINEMLLGCGLLPSSTKLSHGHRQRFDMEVSKRKRKVKNTLRDLPWENACSFSKAPRGSRHSARRRIGLCQSGHHETRTTIEGHITSCREEWRIPASHGSLLLPSALRTQTRGTGSPWCRSPSRTFSQTRLPASGRRCRGMATEDLSWSGLLPEHLG